MQYNHVHTQIYVSFFIHSKINCKVLSGGGKFHYGKFEVSQLTVFSPWCQVGQFHSVDVLFSFLISTTDKQCGDPIRCHNKSIIPIYNNGCFRVICCVPCDKYISQSIYTKQNTQ